MQNRQRFAWEICLLYHVTVLFFPIWLGMFQDGTHLCHLLRELYGTAPFSGGSVRIFNETCRRLARSTGMVLVSIAMQYFILLSSTPRCGGFGWRS